VFPTPNNIKRGDTKTNKINPNLINPNLHFCDVGEHIKLFSNNKNVLLKTK